MMLTCKLHIIFTPLILMPIALHLTCRCGGPLKIGVKGRPNEWRLPLSMSRLMSIPSKCGIDAGQWQLEGDKVFSSYSQLPSGDTVAIMAGFSNRNGIWMPRAHLMPLVRTRIA